MKIVFAGTPEFAATALQALLDAGFPIAHVLTQPDRPAGRGLQLQASAVKQCAQQQQIPVWQPATLKTVEAQEQLRALQPDVMIVAAYGLLLPQAVLDIPTYGCINIHASLLPRWRGAAPIHRAIQAGDTETGITIMQMDAGLDTGPMLLREAMPITAQDTTASLHDKLAAQGGRLIVQWLHLLQAGQLPAAVAQPTEPTDCITYAHKIRKEEAPLDWTQPAEVLARQVRAFNPFPVANTSYAATLVKIWQAQAVTSAALLRTYLHAAVVPGTVVGHLLETERTEQQAILVACGHPDALQLLALTELQKSGGKRLPAKQFLQGFALPIGSELK